VCDGKPVDAAAQYRQLLQLGRDEFLAAAAPAALVRHRTTPMDELSSGVHTLTIDEDETYELDQEAVEETRPHGRDLPEDIDLEVYPLAKKPGASFPDRITIGRTSNNDVVIPDTSVSRLHAYVRRDKSGWVFADAGSKNGSQLRGVAVEPRKELALPSRATVKIGDVDLTFYVAADLYSALGGK
jgi:pSer/pThr/pTyr-binding forkhead associated (FHA) protein